MARAQVTVPLDIPDVRVLKTEINAARRIDHYGGKHQKRNDLPSLRAMD